jgi:ABC-2 type transport system ATP-binding protein
MNFIQRLLSFVQKKHKPLEASTVGFSYTKQEVLRDISMHLKEGEVVAIIGPSGCGKSTLLKIIAGIISSLHTGTIKIFGKNRFFTRNHIGFVPQEPAVIPDLSLQENIILHGLNLGMSERAALEEGKKLLHLLQLTESLDKKPTQLSGGQKVRLNIACSLLHNPAILILDEPFAGLDFKNRRLLWHFINAMKKKGMSIILTSHLLAEAQENVNRLIILKKGKMFFSGTVEKLREKMKVGYLYELRFKQLSVESLAKITAYCKEHRIAILDTYERYMMFGVHNTLQKDSLMTYLQKLKLSFINVGLRQPNLDELFLKE